MGMFDSIYVECPKCGEKVEHQSKKGECYLNNYSISDAPIEVLKDCLNDPQYCRHCESWHALYHPDYPPEGEREKLEGVQVLSVRTPPDDELNIHSSQPYLRWWNVKFRMSDFVKKS